MAENDDVKSHGTYNPETKEWTTDKNGTEPKVNTSVEALRAGHTELYEAQAVIRAELDQLVTHSKRLDRELLMMYGAVIILTIGVGRSLKALEKLGKNAVAETS